MSDTVSVFGPVQPRVRKVDLDRPWFWLAAGWSDLLRAPKVSLAYGAALVVLSLLIGLGLCVDSRRTDSFLLTCTQA